MSVQSDGQIITARGASAPMDRSAQGVRCALRVNCSKAPTRKCQAGLLYLRRMLARKEAAKEKRLVDTKWLKIFVTL